MHVAEENRVGARRYLGLILLLGLAACASTAKLINEDLDPVTSVTVTSTKTPMLFYRDNPARAAYARNYLHLAPIEINRSGSYRYYIWISAWSTMETADLAERRDRLESIIVFADSEPVILQLAGWTPDAIGASEPAYLKPVASAADAYYEVTIDQIRHITNAKDVRLSTGSSRSDSYEPWDDQQSVLEGMRAFLEHVAN
jgi:hypothetical protein